MLSTTSNNREKEDVFSLWKKEKEWKREKGREEERKDPVTVPVKQ